MMARRSNTRHFLERNHVNLAKAEATVKLVLRDIQSITDVPGTVDDREVFDHIEKMVRIVYIELGSLVKFHEGAMRALPEDSNA